MNWIRLDVNDESTWPKKGLLVATIVTKQRRGRVLTVHDVDVNLADTLLLLRHSEFCGKDRFTSVMADGDYWLELPEVPK